MVLERLHRVLRLRISTMVLAAALSAWFVASLSLGSSQAAKAPDKVGSFPDMGWTLGPGLPPGYTPRWDIAYAYFPPAQQVVLFGGAPKDAGEGWHNDTWVFQNGSWSQGPAAPPNLSPRGGAAMAYDPSIGKIVLWGGSGPEWPPRFYGTWFWDGTGWSQGPFAPSGMMPRTGAEMVYDPDIDRLVLFAGSGLDAYSDTWLFDGTQWTPGPAAAPGMTSRTFFGMTYDASLKKVVVAGGSGGNDVWYFDGSSWSAGPVLPPDFHSQERVRMAYDPDLGGTLVFGGIGSGQATDDLWLLRNGSWSRVSQGGGAPPWPDPRMDASVLWNPDYDSFMVIGGIQAVDPGNVMDSDTWFFRDAPPVLSSVTVTPGGPNKTQTLTATPGAVQGGYGNLAYEYEWFVNGFQVPGANSTKLSNAFGVNDIVRASVRVTDGLGLTAGWVDSNSVQIIDRAPDESGNALVPSPAYPGTPLQVTVQNVTDPDGDAVTLHYAWTVNGTPAGGDSATLAPDQFQEGDRIEVKITPIDQWGMAGSPGDVQTTIRKSLTVGVAHPGSNVNISGAGFGPNEQVDVMLDSKTGPKLLTATTDSTGSFPQTSVPVPSPLPGGVHSLYGLGRSSQIVAPGFMTVSPIGSIIPTRLQVGQVTNYTGLGFVPGETVSVSFPGGTPVQGVADPTGSVKASLASPAEPYPGGTVTAVAPSGSTNENYSVQPVMTSPPQGSPGSPANVSVTGFGASEVVWIKFDSGQPVTSFTTDPSGSGSTTVTLPAVFGAHTLTATGATSKATRTNKLSLPATVTISPTSGPVGTVVTIDSGPGWVPLSTVHLWFGSTKVADLKADPLGKVHTTYTIPRHGSGLVNIALTDDVLKVKATAPFRII